MARTVAPGTVVLGHGSFEANAVPDVFDARDLEYRPRLQALPGNDLECRPEDRYVMAQAGNSCTGHAVAAMANAVLASQGDTTHVSPYMLYALARRYDDFQGDADVGSSLRGALKGWYYHGLLPDADWPSLDASAPSRTSTTTSDLAALARQRPLGAFYRVNTLRLDDLQSAINELSAIVVGSVDPRRLDQTPCWSPERSSGKKQPCTSSPGPARSKAIGGHAFCIVGYNEVGFLVQNSWGPEWGYKGFATLPYDDWLESGYDAWVARPGVPVGHLRSAPAARSSRSPAAGWSTRPAADLDRLAPTSSTSATRGGSPRRGGSGRRRPSWTSSSTTCVQTHAGWDSRHRAASCSTRTAVWTARRPVSTSPSDSSTGGSPTRSTR